MRRARLLRACFSLVVALTAAANTAPVVGDITAAARTDGSGIVDIACAVSGSGNDRCAITAQVSSDGGSMWTNTLSAGALSGALANVSPEGCTITWASKADLPGVSGSNNRSQATANDRRPPADMVLIPGGTFQMGDSFNEGGDDERPVHTVTLSPFYMGRYEITNAQYRDFLNSALSSGTIYVSDNIVYGTGNNQPYCDTHQSSTYSQIDWDGSTFSVRTKGGRSMDNDPMVMVSWFGAAAYANWRSQQEGRQPSYSLTTWVCDFRKNGYRLPTEAQWEYAARGGLAGKRFPWGDTITHSQANYWSIHWYSYDTSPTRGYHPAWNDGTMPYTSPVGSFAPNGYGLYDMAGNVWEWCNDWYDSYTPSSKTNPTGPTTGTWRVVRGGGWFNDAYFCRVAYRFSNSPPSTRHVNYGFRLSLSHQ
ncbi:MAG TPA: formylglycine-generating enzyme family protein [Sedimentisphaerales bacterium]|nr:formylglycine-generating enzyme family protein [Sedimentisphaerales bacterium]